ncbi:MAG TPA: DUF5655 domain-containing protein [Candidatus Limnocylindria bacterium]
MAQRPLWTCPRCGKSYVTRNMWHSCVTVPLDSHFGGRPRSRELYDAVVDFLEADGPVTVSISKTRIEFMTRAHFGGVRVMRDWPWLAFWLKRRIESDRFDKVDYYGGRDWGYRLRLRDESQLDDELRGWLGESRTVGDQLPQTPGRNIGT